MMRVAFSRPRHVLAESIQMAKELGFQPYAVPSMDLVPMPMDKLHTFRDQVMRGQYRALIFTSNLAADYFLDFDDNESLKVVLAKTRVLAIGPGTAKALENHGLSVHELPEKHSSVGLVQSFGPSLRGQKVALIRSDKGTDVLREGLEAGGTQVTEMHVYTTRPILDSEEMGKLIEKARPHGIDAYAFTSALTVRGFLHSSESYVDKTKMLELLQGSLVAAIGEPTAEELASHGVRVDIVSHNADFYDLLRSIRDTLMNSNR